MMRALTLTQPWAGLVASGIKLVENRPRRIIKASDIGTRFAIHASREINERVYERIAQIAPDILTIERTAAATIHTVPCLRDWYRFSRDTSAVIAVATLDKEFHGGWNAEVISRHADLISFSNGELLGQQQLRWFFGPVVYALREVVALPTPVPCKGKLGFWTLPDDVELAVRAQLRERAA